MAAPRGERAFFEHYATTLSERWFSLSQALGRPPRRVLRENGFAGGAGPQGDRLRKMSGLGGCYHVHEAAEAALDARGSHDLRRFYAMDAGSVVAARALLAGSGERVLDMCAAPGGKALVLAEAVHPNGALVLNDRSKRRLGRLKSVLDEYVPPGVRKTISLSCRDGKRLGQTWPETFDAILLDAPCSSERHVLADPLELQKWSPGRVKRLSIEQFALLSSAFLALKPGGRLLYCTCALLPQENDDVVERLLKRRSGAVAVDRVSAPLGEATRHGWQIWPDQTGFGPIYFARLVKAG